MVTTILLLFSFLHFISAIYPDCKSGKIIFDPSSPETSYPAPYTYPPPVFPANFSCEFQIIVPEGKFARVTLSLTSPHKSQSSAVIFDQLNRSETVFEADSEYFFFIANGGRIQFSTSTHGVRFGFYFSWNRYPTYTFPGGRVNVSDTQPFPAIWPTTDRGASISIEAETKVSATLLRPQSDNQLKYLRSVIFFDGPDWNNNTKSLGTGLQLFNGKTQYVSTGNSMKVLMLESPPVQFVQLFFQDYEVTKGIKSFQGAYCNDRSPCGSFTLDATNGPAALQVLNADSVTVISDLSGTGQLEVYIGTASRNKTNLVTTYHAGETNSSLPQKVFGYFKTFLLTDGNATITFNDNLRDENMYVSVGSTGFISSDSYGTYALQQRCLLRLLISPENTTVKFRFSISQFNLVGNTWLNFYGDGGVTWFRTYTPSHPPKLNSYQEFSGTEFLVDCDNNYIRNKGFLMRYEIGENSNNRILVLLSTVLVFIMYFD
ncbi:hypothetical protein B9Z55_021327 [Caenorhabditis nigoni]|uniref:Uncharacterized protein n=1 Tax=Caenorhabditis nigoni TaxID=1611254 RepID=A0A2G5TRM7_9PELO|nr:hypothetical protein B9Z55_021327 [Caenorhabditis nigoni]